MEKSQAWCATHTADGLKMSNQDNRNTYAGWGIVLWMLVYFLVIIPVTRSFIYHQLQQNDRPPQASNHSSEQSDRR